MLSLLLLIILLMAISLLVLRRDLRSTLIFLSVSSITFFMYTILVYIAKKGGISEITTIALYGTNRIRQWLQFRVFTVNKLGFMMALGRYLSPFFLLLTALNMVDKLDTHNALKRALILFILPLISIVVYYPAFFERFSASESIMSFVVNFSKAWIIIYLITAVVSVFVELYAVKLSFFKRRFVMKVLIIVSLTLIYTLYFPQDPAQVYLFYRNEYMWMLGLWYLHRGFSSGLYYIVMFLSFFAGIVSISSLIRYFSSTFGEEQVEVKVIKESRSALRGVSMFVHGTKNDLLSTRILLEKERNKYSEDEDIKKLITINSGLVSRLEKLNKAIKVNTVKLRPVTVGCVLEEAIKRTKEIFPDYPIECDGILNNSLTLADLSFLPEAIFNVIQNAIEATLDNNKRESVLISVEEGRTWVEINISDRGKGITKSIKKHIWEHFQSSKNSSTNWGIGMYFIRLVIKRHLGSISFRPRKDGGTCFMIMLPLAGRKKDD